MIVAFMHVDVLGNEVSRKLAQIMVRSVREAMPSADIVQLTDTNTLPLAGVHACIHRRMEFPWLMLYRLDHFRNLPHERAMFIDTDAVVQKDTEVVFERPFDVALTRRTGVILVDGKNIVPEMPYNSGVMFSRGQAFWNDCYEYCATLPNEQKHWYGDQMTLKVLVDRGKHNVLELSCNEFNYSPSQELEDVSGKYVVHYKGKRKKWMLEKYDNLDMEIA
jgi:hypothetical protein